MFFRCFRSVLISGHAVLDHHCLSVLCLLNLSWKQTSSTSFMSVTISMCNHLHDLGSSVAWFKIWLVRCRFFVGVGIMISYGLIGVGRECLVCITTGYGLDSLGIEFRRGRDFQRLFRPSMEPTQPPVEWVPCLFPTGIAAGALPWQRTPSSAEVKEAVPLFHHWELMACLPL
jgi:hypothetical protein